MGTIYITKNSQNYEDEWNLHRKSVQRGQKARSCLDSGDNKSNKNGITTIDRGYLASKGQGKWWLKKSEERKLCDFLDIQ